MNLTRFVSILSILACARGAPPIEQGSNAPSGRPSLHPTSHPRGAPVRSIASESPPASVFPRSESPQPMTSSPPTHSTPTNASKASTPLPPGTSPRHRGLNVPGHIGGLNTPFKSLADWTSAFTRIKTIPTYNAARVYATQDDGAIYLPDQLSAAKTANISLLLGIYLGWNDEAGARFNKEFDVLKAGLTEHGIENVIGISVGNEDLYAKHSTPDQIASQIKQVQEWLDAQFEGNCIPVGHTDTWTEVINPANSAVAEVSDFLVANVFPYWENSTIDTATEYFDAAMGKVDEFAATQGVEVWIGETGWPVAMPAQGFPGVVGTEGLQRYWRDIACSPAFIGRHSFFYVDHDDGDVPQWGLFGEDGKPRIDLVCPGPV